MSNCDFDFKNQPLTAMLFDGSFMIKENDETVTFSGDRAIVKMDIIDVDWEDEDTIVDPVSTMVFDGSGSCDEDGTDVTFSNKKVMLTLRITDIIWL
jgi:hypothetical protein